MDEQEGPFSKFLGPKPLAAVTDPYELRATPIFPPPTSHQIEQWTVWEPDINLLQPSSQTPTVSEKSDLHFDFSEPMTENNDAKIVTDMFAAMISVVTQSTKFQYCIEAPSEKTYQRAGIAATVVIVPFDFLADSQPGCTWTQEQTAMYISLKHLLNILFSTTTAAEKVLYTLDVSPDTDNPLPNVSLVHLTMYSLFAQ